MSYRDRTREGGSFRGVKFVVKSRKRTGGRRGPDNEFPARNETESEDTGARVRGFRVVAIIGGPDYDLQRNRLLSALEIAGAGTYVDPWLGEFQVIARDYSLLEEDRAGGIATFELQFALTEEPQFPQIAPDTASQVKATGDAFAEIAKLVGDQGMVVDKVPQFVVNDLAARGDIVAGLVGNLSKEVPTLAPSMTDVVSAFRTGIPGTVRTGFASATGDMFSQVGAIVAKSGVPLSEAGYPEVAVPFFARMGDIATIGNAVSETTGTRKTQAANAGVYLRAVQRFAVIEEARAISALQFDSVDQARDVRDSFLGRLDGITRASGANFQDDIFSAAIEMRRAVVQDVEIRSGGLPRRRELTPKAALPAVVLAHQLYGDATRRDDLVRRNKGYRHPGFAPNAPLEYLDS